MEGCEGPMRSNSEIKKKRRISMQALLSRKMMRVNVLASVASESRPICAWALLHCITLHSLHPLTGGAPLKTVM